MTKNGKKSRVMPVVLFLTALSFFVGFLLLITPNIIEKYKAGAKEEIIENMKNIHTSAIMVDEIEMGLHEDTGENGKYSRLSELSGFRVYNSPAKNKYSVSKDYKSGKITVKYGTDLVYPELITDKKEISVDGEILNENLFTYDESSGKVVLTGFSEEGVSLLQADNVIQIPMTYKGREVVEIADKAFYNKNIIGTVVIPSNIEKIGSNAFANNGIKGVSNNIENKPYEGSWKVDERKWIKSN